MAPPPPVTTIEDDLIDEPTNPDGTSDTSIMEVILTEIILPSLIKKRERYCATKQRDRDMAEEFL